MQFSLIGFSQDTGFRVFAFQGTAADRTRSEYTVRADLALTRKYGIRVQELPLLCRGLLERAGEGEQTCTATFTEEEMCTRITVQRLAMQRCRIGSRRARLPQTTSEATGEFHSSRGNCPRAGSEDQRIHHQQRGGQMINEEIWRAWRHLARN
jgi:hypothetical protein